MSAQPARRPPPSRRSAPAPRTPAPARRTPAPARTRAARLEQRRRRRHLQQLRRDALTDLAVAVGLMIVTLLATAGLGVVALLEIAVAPLLIASFVVERRRRGRKGAASGQNRPNRPR